MMRTRGGVVVLGLAAGLAAGWFWAAARQDRHRAGLFSASRARRRAALGWLAGDQRVETVTLLRDYLRWEREPRLRTRAAALLARLEADLGLGAA